MTPTEVREWLQQVADAQLRLRANEAMMASSGLVPSTDPKGKGGTADPTASAAMLSEECDELRRFVDEGRELCLGVRLALGVPGNVLEMRYLRLMSWPAISSELRISKRTAHRMEQQAREWVSYVGPANASMGRGVAEGR